MLITGAGGFIGRHILKAASSHGLKAVGWTRSEVDLTTADLAPLLRELRPRIIINAATYGVGADERDPERMQAINVDAVSRLMTTARAAGVARFVQLGTYSEYGDQAGTISEDTPLAPKESYATSKAAASRLVADRAATAPVEGIVLRLFNVFGPGERPHRLLPQLLSHARAGTRVPLTAGTQIKEWCYVGDVADWILDIALIATPWPYAVVNLGTGVRLSVRDMALTAARALGCEHLLDFGAVPVPAKEVQTGVADLARIAALLPNRRITPISEAIAATLGAS